MSQPIHLKLKSTIVAVPFTLMALISSSTVFAQTTTQSVPASRCISGYPDGTYRGDRPVTRYEFAAGMNACLDSVNQTLQLNRSEYATKADLESLIQRQRELNQQLRELNDRVGPLIGDNPPANR